MKVIITTLILVPALILFGISAGIILIKILDILILLLISAGILKILERKGIIGGNDWIDYATDSSNCGDPVDRSKDIQS